MTKKVEFSPPFQFERNGSLELYFKESVKRHFNIPCQYGYDTLRREVDGVELEGRELLSHEEALQLAKQLLYEEGEIERRLGFGSTSSDEGKKEREALEAIERRIEEIATLYPDIKRKNFDDSYRFQSSAEIASAIEEQNLANLQQMERINGRRQSEGNRECIELPHEIGHGLCDRSERLVVAGMEVGVSNRKGRRDWNEDTHIAEEFHFSLRGKKHPIQLFAVFDGHGGGCAAKFVKRNFQEKFLRGLAKFNKETLRKEGIWKALHWTCVELDKELISTMPYDPSGTTAAAALILDGHLWSLNVGDSRILLDRNGECEQLTEDASPCEEKYLNGVRQRGGFVHEGRVQGILAVCRSIGDGWSKGAVSAAPSISLLPLSALSKGKPHHLIVTCDGIFEEATQTRSADIVELTHQYSHMAPHHLASYITGNALQLGSCDNLSAIVVRLPCDTLQDTLD